MKKSYLSAVVLTAILVSAVTLGGCFKSSYYRFDKSPKTSELLEKLHSATQEEFDTFTENFSGCTDQYDIAKITSDGPVGGVSEIKYSGLLNDRTCFVTCGNETQGDFSCEGDPILTEESVDALVTYCETKSEEILNDPNAFKPQPACQKNLIKDKEESEDKAEAKTVISYSLPTTATLLGSLSKVQDQAEMRRRIKVMKNKYRVSDISAVFDEMTLDVSAKTNHGVLDEASLYCYVFESSWVSPVNLYGDSDAMDGVSTEVEQKMYCENISAKILADPEVFPQ
jgi:hypothetical protein